MEALDRELFKGLVAKDRLNPLGTNHAGATREPLKIRTMFHQCGHAINGESAPSPKLKTDEIGATKGDKDKGLIADGIRSVIALEGKLGDRFKEEE